MPETIIKWKITPEEFSIRLKFHPGQLVVHKGTSVLYTIVRMFDVTYRYEDKGYEIRYHCRRVGPKQESSSPILESELCVIEELLETNVNTV